MDGVLFMVFVATDVAGRRKLGEQSRAGQRPNNDHPLQPCEPKELPTNPLIIPGLHLLYRGVGDATDHPEDQPVVGAGGVT